MKRKISIVISLILIHNFLFIDIAIASDRPYITIGDREFIVNYEDYTRINNQFEGYNPKLSYPLAQFSAYLASQSYRNPVELREAGLVDSSNKYFGEILKKNNFQDIKLIHNYDNARIYMDTFLKSYGGLWRFIKRGSGGEIDITDPRIQTLAKASTQAIVGYKWIHAKGKKRRVISITFRGTEGLNNIKKLHEDWLISTLSKKIDFNGKGKVHRGYYACALEFEKMESKIYFDNKSLKEIIDNANQTGDLIILSGHSSGGAIASIYAAMLIDKEENSFPRDQIQIYSFGAPPFSDKAFSKIYSSSANADKLLNLHRIVERYDIVPYSSRGAKLKSYTKDIFAGAVSENETLRKSKLLKKLFKTESPEFKQIGYSEEYENGQKIPSDDTDDSSMTTRDKLYFFMEEVNSRKLSHHTMSWYISVLNKEALKYKRGDLGKPEVFYKYKNNKVFIYTLEKSEIYYSFDTSAPSMKRTNKINTSGYVDIKGNILTFFAIDEYGNMSSIKSVGLRNPSLSKRHYEKVEQ